VEWAFLIAAGVGAVAAAVGVIIQLLRRPRLPEPSVSIERLYRPDDAPEWVAVVLQTRNTTDVAWRGETVQVIRPRRAKVISERALPRVPSPAHHAPGDVLASEIDAARLSNSAASSVFVAPKGARSGTLISGTNDTEIETFWVLPPQSRRPGELSIRFSLLSTDSSRRRSRHDFTRNPIPTRNSPND
jgi:hypothetical protein